MNKVILLLIILFLSCEKTSGKLELAENFTGTDILAGSGETVDDFDHVTVNYTGWLVKDSTDLYGDWSGNTERDADKFDSSFDRNSPFDFQLNTGSVIRGWDIGVKGMKEGGKRILVIPSELGYGARGAGPKIPPHSTLKFLVEIVSVIKIDNATVRDSVVSDGKVLVADDLVQMHYTMKKTQKGGQPLVQSSKQGGFPITLTIGNPGNPFFVKDYIKGMKTKSIRIIDYDTKEGHDQIIIESLDLVEKAKPWPLDNLTFKTTKSGLQCAVVKKGKGKKVKSGDMISVHYSGFLNNNLKKFDSSVERGQPIQFPVGTGRVIPGWDEGLQLLNVGSKAVLIIPPALAYGDKEVGPIPANSVLRFDVEVVESKSK